MAKTSAKTPVTAMLGASMFFSGVTFASTLPYGAIVGIETLGMTNANYAFLVSFGALVGAVVSVLIGYISDRLHDRRILVLIAAAAGTLGYGLIYLFRNELAFVIAIGVIMPFGLAMFSQNFAFVRVFYHAHNPARADFMVSAMRTIFALAWVVVPPIAGFVAAQYSVFDVYLLAALAYAACGCVFLFMMRDPATRVAATPIVKREPGTRAGLPGHIISGIVGIVVISVSMRLVGLAMPLSIITRLDGTLADVGIYAGIAAALEIPFMLMWGWLGSRLPRETIIIGNALLFALYVVLVSQAQSVTDVFWLQGLNGIATAALLSITISYLQDAIKGRVGLSTSLMDVTSISATLLGAFAFGVLSSGGNYQLTLLVAAAISGLGALIMLSGNLGHLRKAQLEAGAMPTQ